MENNYYGPSFLQRIRDWAGISSEGILLYVGRPPVMPPIIVEESGESKGYALQNKGILNKGRSGQQNLTRKILSD